MKHALIITALLLSMVFSLIANDIPDPGRALPSLDLPQGKLISPPRTPPSFTFSRNPVSLMTSYYDYMIGSYNGLPLRVIPQIAGGGYFMTYHGKRTPTAIRRVFHAYLDNNGNVINNNEISPTYINEGYPTLAVDPVSGKPLYAWHCNIDTDALYEDILTSDAFIAGIAGLFNDNVTIQNAPITITPTNYPATSDNEFIWPTAVIGPSPVAGKRRVYVVMRNSVTHSYGPSENPYIRFADFNADDIEGGIPLVWNTSNFTIPEMDNWNHAPEWRRPFHAIAVDNAGNLYYSGYHFATMADGTTYIPEADLDIFKCPNYGQGTWSRISSFSNLPSWNPPEAPGSTVGYFKDGNNIPYTDDELYWVIANSSHLNATVDNNGKLHVPATWELRNVEGVYYPDLQFIKEFVFNPATSQFSIKDIYPQRHPDNTNDQYYQPWDSVAPWGAVDSYLPDGSGGFYPEMVNDWPYPYWDETAHGDAMMFHYNNTKVTESNGEGMMAVVWQNSLRSRLYNHDSDTDYAAYANSPEIFIAVSPDNGNTWSEPIILNNVTTPQFANLKPMWVYPADKVKYMGMQGNQKIGKLGLMFYNDYTWGSNVITPSVHPTNDGGQVMFAELQIVFPLSGPAPTDPFGTPVVLSGSMAVVAGILIEGQMAAAGDMLAAFVDVNGTPQLRGKQQVVLNNNIAGCLIQVFTETNGEIVYFKLWDASTNEVLSIAETLPSQVNGTVGTWPDNLFWLHAGAAWNQNISLQPGWNMVSLNVHPANTAISSIMAGILNDVIMVKSPEGVYVPNNPYNTLSNLSDGKGYFVKLNNPRTLTVVGMPLDPIAPIPLLSGWNLVGFTPQVAIPVEMALNSIEAYIEQVKGVEGVYIPDNPYNTLTTLSPGRSYWIDMNQAAPLVYNVPVREAYLPQELPICSTWGTPVIKTNSQVILCELGDYAASGDQLAAFVNGELRGLSPIREAEGRIGSYLQVFTDVPDETISFKLIKTGSAISIELSPAIQSIPGTNTGDYRIGSYYQLSKVDNETPGLPTALINAYPNPFNSTTSISLRVEKNNTPLKLEIYNLKGQKVKTLFSGPMVAGTQSIAWNGLNENGQHVATGVYFCRLSSSGQTQNIKLMILK